MYESINDVVEGTSVACKFRVTTMLDSLGRPAPNLSDQPLAGPGEYSSVGVIMQRDREQELVKLEDTQTKRQFVVAYADIWDIDDVEWEDPLDA
jgi:hypothetical protein